MMDVSEYTWGPVPDWAEFPEDAHWIQGSSVDYEVHEMATVFHLGFIRIRLGRLAPIVRKLDTKNITKGCFHCNVELARML